MKISVYITSYNQKGFLNEAVESVLNQTLQPFEIIIVDDCSTDGSQDLIETYCKDYPQLIKKHFNSKNLGITKSRNKALSLVTGDYLTWLDGDDIYKSQKLEVESKLLIETKADLVYSNFYYSKDTIENIFQIWCDNINQLPSNKIVFKEVVSRDFPRETLFRYELIDVKLLRLVGDYDENLNIYEDFDFRIRLAEIAKTAYNIEPLSVYRIHGNGLSKVNGNIHQKNLNYIFTKNENKILNLKEEERHKVQQAILNFMSRFSNTTKELSSTLSVKNRIKNKLIRGIKNI